MIGSGSYTCSHKEFQNGETALAYNKKLYKGLQEEKTERELLAQIAWDVRVTTHAICALVGAIIGIVIGGWLMYTYCL